MSRKKSRIYFSTAQTNCNLFRPLDDSRKALILLRPWRYISRVLTYLLTFIDELFATRSLINPADRTAPSTPVKSMSEVGSSVWHEKLTVISPIPPLYFTVVKSAKYGLNFRRHKTEQQIGNVKDLRRAPMFVLCPPKIWRSSVRSTLKTSD